MLPSQSIDSRIHPPTPTTYNRAHPSSSSSIVSLVRHEPRRRAEAGLREWKAGVGHSYIGTTQHASDV